MDVNKMFISKEAYEDMEGLGLKEDTVREMVRLSVPFHHVMGNRRYKQFVFDYDPDNNTLNTIALRVLKIYGKDAENVCKTCYGERYVTIIKHYKEHDVPYIGRVKCNDNRCVNGLYVASTRDY